jgi:hydroxymethylpyrimidine pyrophosphatase-like HAD family hydrolase
MADRQALARIVEAGIRVSLSTGRVSQACRSVLELLSLDGYHVFSDGALVADPESDREVYVEPIRPELVKEIVEFIHEQEMRIDLYSSRQFFVEREDWVTDIRRKFFGLEPTLMDFSSVWHNERVIKGTLVVHSLEEKAQAAHFRSYFRDRLNLSWTIGPGRTGLISRGSAVGGCRHR